MFEDYQMVKLARDFPEHGLTAGSRGAVLMAYPQRPQSPQEYEIEFVDEDGETLAVLTMPESDLEAT